MYQISLIVWSNIVISNIHGTSFRKLGRSICILYKYFFNLVRGVSSTNNVTSVCLVSSCLVPIHSALKQLPVDSSNILTTSCTATRIILFVEMLLLVSWIVRLCHHRRCGCFVPTGAQAVFHRSLKQLLFPISKATPSPSTTRAPMILMLTSIYL